MSPRCAAHSEPLARRNLIDAKARIRVIEPLELVMQVADAAAAENRLVQHRAAGALLDVLPAAPSRYSTRFSIWQQGGRKCHSAERDARVDCGARRPAACARRRTPRGLRRIGGSFRSRLPQSCGTRRSPSTTSHDAHVQRSGNRKNTDDGLRCHVPTSWVVQFLPSPRDVSACKTPTDQRRLCPPPQSGSPAEWLLHTSRRVRLLRRQHLCNSGHPAPTSIGNLGQDP